jgi:ribosomal protein S18 acetylase RimI-like enzyme
MELLGEVLELHAKIRPDIFIPGTTKYTEAELAELLKDEERPVYVSVDEDGRVWGYAFCQVRRQPFTTNMVPFKSMFIDDLCVDETARRQYVGQQLYDYALDYARKHGYYNVTLHVWGGNDSALHFYQKMGMHSQYQCLEQIL